MSAHLLLVAALAGSPVFAQDPPPPPPAAEAHASLAEARRLQTELRTLAKKNAWTGVDRAFRELELTGVMPEYDDYFFGAHAARALGDIGTTRTRLRRCLAIREEKEVVDWLWEIDEHYGPITLQGDLGRVHLDPKVHPFDPVAAQAVVFAVDQVEHTGSFDGYLPAGEYGFGHVNVAVKPRVSGDLVDIRTQRGARKRRGRKR